MANGRVVLKLGSQVVVDENGQLRKQSLSTLLSHIIPYIKSGGEVLIVSSGAIAIGASILKKEFPQKTEEKQVCASVGQAKLVSYYQDLFDIFDQKVGQVLVTASDLGDRKRYLNLRSTLDGLLQNNVIPIINENDSVSTFELVQDKGSPSFGDNDKLAALVSAKIGAQWLLMISTVGGIYDFDPKKNRKAKRISKIDSISDLMSVDASGVSTYGRGGMTSKIEAARVASLCGINTFITSGENDAGVKAFFQSTDEKRLIEFGTYISPVGKISGKKQWVGFSGTVGKLEVNDGAIRALQTQKASLLPVGITKVEGDFSEKSLVAITRSGGGEIARGISYFSSKVLKKLIGMNSVKIRENFGAPYSREAIHKNELVVFGEGDEDES